VLTQLVPYSVPECKGRAEQDQPLDTQLLSLNVEQEASPQQPSPPREPALLESGRECLCIEEDGENWKSLVIACSKSQLPRLKTAILNGDSALHFIRKDGCTLLHVAAAAGSWRVVDLLLDAGVSPMPRDRRRKSAYDVSKDKETRDSFRRGMYVFIENTPRSVFL
jgi:hypothetical protein